MKVGFITKMFEAGGIHIFIDVKTEEGKMPEFSDMMNVLQFASEAAGSKVLGHSYKQFDDNEHHSLSYTICYLLSESHASVHTWPEHNFLSIDFFFCGAANYNKAIEYVMGKLKYKTIKVEKHRRGENHEGTYRQL